MRLIEVDPRVVEYDVRLFPEDQESFIFEHLLHYLKRLEVLPAITVREQDCRLVVVRGHKYLKGAKELGRDRIRAVVEGTLSADLESLLTNQGKMMVLDWRSIKREEEERAVAEVWHVFFFERPLGEEDKEAFEKEIVRFFDSLDSLGGASLRSAKPISNWKGAEFSAKTPLGTETWFRGFLDACHSFSRHFVPIESYQGRRFQGE